MRIITGSGRGRKLQAVPGEQTRPTSDRSKETLFNIIQFDIEGRRVLDLFAGSGQLGIEALSRGAASAVFVDMSAKAISVIRKNLESTEFVAQAVVVPGEALSYLGSAPGKFDLVLLDPPYDSPLLDKALAAAARFDICAPGGIIVCECAQEQDLPALTGPYAWGKSYRCGRTKIVLAHRRGELP